MREKLPTRALVLLCWSFEFESARGTAGATNCTVIMLQQRIVRSEQQQNGKGGFASAVDNCHYT